MLEKSKSLYNVEMITIFKRWNNVSLSALNQRQNLKLKQRWFWVEHKIIFVLMFCSSFDGRIIDVISMHIVDSTCFFWCLFKRKKSWSLCLLLISFRYFKNESRLAVSFRCNLISMYFFKVISLHLDISSVIIQCLRTVTLVNICSDLICLQWQWFSTNILWKFAGNSQRSVSFHKLQVFENIHECFFISVTLKADFRTDVLLQIFLLFHWN